MLRISTCLWAALVAASVSSTTEAFAGEKCRHVTAHTASDLQLTDCTSPVGLCTIGTVTGDHWLNGSFNFIAPAVGPSAGLPASVEPATTLSYGGEFTVFGEHGSITYRTIGVYDTLLQLWTEVDRIVSGTGMFANASGAIYINGVGLNGGLHLEGNATGEVCIER